MGSSLAHVMVVAGTRRDWAAIDEAGWRRLAGELGTVVADAGGAWLTIRAYESGEDVPASSGLDGLHLTAADGRCVVLIDPVSDGRERFASAMRQLPAGSAVDEKAVAGVLYAPADVEPDLVLVLGPSTRLPPSLVWELAYGELVFLPIALADLRGQHLVEAIEDFQGRRRRFGGLDT
ncbi:MAG: undecaprenyl diphosphate synthase family protein [Ilumatobacteraceae bacterium]